MSDMWRNDYTHAGKGRKARLRLEEINAKNMQLAKPRDKRSRYERKPEMERKRAEEFAASESYHTAQGVKARIQYLLLDRDASYLEICEIMRREKCPVTGVTISNVRTAFRDALKLLEREGLLNVEALAKRRKRGSRERVK